MNIILKIFQVIAHSPLHTTTVYHLLFTAQNLVITVVYLQQKLLLLQQQPEHQQVLPHYLQQLYQPLQSIKEIVKIKMI